MERQCAMALLKKVISAPLVVSRAAVANLSGLMDHQWSVDCRLATTDLEHLENGSQST